MSFWQENVIVIVILLRILARMLPLEDTSYKGFIIVRLGDSLTSYNQHNSANFRGAKEVQWLYLWRLLFENSWKNFKSNLVLVESKGLWYLLELLWDEVKLSNEATLTQARLVTPLGVLSFDSFFFIFIFLFFLFPALVVVPYFQTHSNNDSPSSFYSFQKPFNGQEKICKQ